MYKIEKTKEILNRLKKRYGKEPLTHLDYNKDFEFLFAVIMAAQCKDARVNIVTKNLFKKYPKLTDYAKANLKEFENDIKQTGFYHNKAKNILETSKILLYKYNGKVPNNFNDLISLPGVGRKTANVIMSHYFNKGGIAVDTHVKRIANKLGLTSSLDPKTSEFELLKLVKNKKDQCVLNTHIIAFGREICKARNPKCEICFLRDLCNYVN